MTSHGAERRRTSLDGSPAISPRSTRARRPPTRSGAALRLVADEPKASRPASATNGTIPTTCDHRGRAVTGRAGPRSSGTSHGIASAGTTQREELRQDPRRRSPAPATTGRRRAPPTARRSRAGPGTGRTATSARARRRRPGSAAGCRRGAARSQLARRAAWRRQARWPHADDPADDEPERDEEDRHLARRTATRRRRADRRRTARARYGTTIGTSANGGYSRGTSRYGREPAKRRRRLVEVQADVALGPLGSPPSASTPRPRAGWVQEDEQGQGSPGGGRGARSGRRRHGARA